MAAVQEEAFLLRLAARVCPLSPGELTSIRSPLARRAIVNSLGERAGVRGRI